MEMVDRLGDSHMRPPILLLFVSIAFNDTIVLFTTTHLLVLRVTHRCRSAPELSHASTEPAPQNIRETSS